MMRLSLVLLPTALLLSRRAFSASATVMLQPGLISPQAAKQTRSAFLAGLIGDALSLGGHYEYDARKIKANGGYAIYSKPGEANNGIGWGTANYHPGKVAGDLTDAGDIAIMLLSHLSDLQAASASYSFDSFASYWKKQIDNGYGSCNFQSVGRDAKGCPKGLKPGYLNGGTRRTLQLLATNPTARGEARKALAADVNCLVSATHFLPLFFVQQDEEMLVKNAISTVYLSHKNSDPVAAAEFLTRALYRIIHHGMGLEDALAAAAQRTNHRMIFKWLHDAEKKVAEAKDTTSALAREEFVDDIAITSMARLWDVGKSEPIKVGKASPTEGALPAALYFALKYKDNMPHALIANANVGGDNAARGIVIGMLLGALPGNELPATHRWMTELNALPAVQRLIDTLLVDTITARPLPLAHGGGGGEL